MASDAGAGEALLRWRRAQDARVMASAVGSPCRVAPGEAEAAAGQRVPRRWPEAALVAPLALYSHGYRRYPLPAADGDGEATACHHCPFLLAERGPFLVAPLLPPESAFGLVPEGPTTPGEGCHGTDWHPAPYGPGWGQPLYLSPAPRRKAAPGPLDGTAGSGDKDLYPPKNLIFPLLAEDRVPSPPLSRAPAGTARQDGDANPGPPGHPLQLLPPSAPRGSWAGAWPHADRFPLEPAPESLAHLCPAAASPPAPREPSPWLCPPSHAEEPAGCVCVPAGHPAKLKQTWLSRHSAQCSPRRRAPAEGKRTAKHTAGEAPSAAKRGTRAMERAGTPEGTAIPAEEPAEGGAGPRQRGHLQSVPCTALPAGIPRCCACAAHGHRDGDDGDGETPESACRLLHFRRLAPGSGGELRAAGVCSLEDAQGQALPPVAAGTGYGDGAGELRAAKYLLAVLGDAFCEAVRRDRAAWRAAGAAARQRGAAWRRGDGAPRLCDSCQRGLFNSHWSCPRCGFQLCPDCHGRGRHERSQAAVGPECVPRQQHDAGSLVPTQFVPAHVLTELWTRLHEARAQAGIPARCPCTAEDTGSAQEEPGTEMPQVKPSGASEADASQMVKEVKLVRTPGAPVHGARLRDLLASTAVKLCPAHGAVRMAFAPVAPALPDDTRLASLLESVIARVVERKIQEQHLVPNGDAAASHRLLAPGGPLWLLQPEPPGAYALFQQHWRQGQPVLVSGLQERPGVPEAPLLEAQDGEEPPAGAHVATERFWDGFARSTAEPRCDGDPESGLGDTQPWRAAELDALLPLREYCGPRGRLNLAAHLHGERGACRLRPRLRVTHGSPDGSSGTKMLSVEAADSVSVLVQAGAAPRDRPGLLQRAEEAGVAVALRERLGDARCRPGALWHVFRAEDAGRIRGFLQRVGAAAGSGAAHPGSAQPGRDAGMGPGTCYLDVRLRRRLHDECGVSCCALLQCLGDAVLVPAGAPHQVQTLTSTVSLEQRFLSPESAARLWDPSASSTSTTGTARCLRAQLDAMIFSAVREAVGVLQGCK